MTLTTDDLVASIILKYNPLHGPILLDYLTNNKWYPGLVTTCFQKQAKDCRFPREELSMTWAARNFWRLVGKWLNPTQSVVHGWIRDLIRHTIVMDEIFYDGNMENHVMDQVHLVCASLLRMHGCVAHAAKIKPEMFESTYAEALKSKLGKRAAMKVLLAVVERGERNINITRTSMELVNTLRKAVSEMWKNTIFHQWLETPDDYEDNEKFEMQERYQVLFYKDGMTDHDEEQWLRYPSLIYARNLTLQKDKVNMDEIDLTEATWGSDYWDRIKAFMFYSYGDEALMDEKITEYIEERTEDGGVLNYQIFHTDIPNELHQDVAIESNNADHLRKYLEQGFTPNRPDSPEPVPHIQSGISNDPGEETGPVKEETESGVLTFIVFGAVIGFIFIQA